MKIIHTGIALAFFSMTTFAIDTEAPTQEIDPSTQAPNILYVIPWSDAPTKKAKDPKLVLHNLIGDLYEPQIPSDW